MKMRRFMIGMICTLAAVLALGLETVTVYGADDAAVRVDVDIKAVNGESTAKLKDDSYSTKIVFTADNYLTVSSADGSALGGIYVVFDRVPGTWECEYGGASIQGGTLECGKNGFIHEYVALPDGVTSVRMTFSGSEKLCYIQGYSRGTLPDDVQVWEAPCDKADILLLSSHADDEILFFGGILPEYAGERKLKTQVVYFSNYFNGTVIREHEKLDGLWTCGVRNYPVNADFDDTYADDLAAAEKLYDYDTVLGFVVGQIRRFKPQICVAQDTNGEYGHGTHMLTSKAMQEAVTVSMDAEKYPESAAEYGTWDVPKTYIHLLKTNAISIDCRKPLEAFGGQSALEVATAAYKKHVSQQWCWFYVSDTYEYSMSEYGLYRSTVGDDTGNDIMEHLTSYEEQTRQLEEARQQAEERRKAKAEAEEQSRTAKEKHDYEELYGASPDDVSPEKLQNFMHVVGGNLLKIIGIVLAVVALAAVVGIIRNRVLNSRKRRRRKNHR